MPERLWTILIAAAVSLGAGGCATTDGRSGEPSPVPGGDCSAQRSACVELCRPRGVGAFECAGPGHPGSCECLGGEAPAGTGSP